jgi:hypothetical protein
MKKATSSRLIRAREQAPLHRILAQGGLDARGLDDLERHGERA